MHTTTASTAPMQPARIRGMLRIVSRLHETLRQRFEMRETERELASLDDRILRDIGLTRDDLTRRPDAIAAQRRRSMDMVARQSAYHLPGNRP